MKIPIPQAIQQLYALFAKYRIVDSKDTIAVETLNGVEILLRNELGGESGGEEDTYNGYFKPSYSGNVITIAAGKFKAGNYFGSVAETSATATAAGFVILTVTYSSGYSAAVSFVTSLSNPSDSNEIILLATVEWDSKVTAVNRHISGVALVTGKVV